MQFDIITIFPNIFNSYFQTSILKRAQEKKIIKIKIHDLRFWANDKHKTVDDVPYGGGPGMIFKIEPIYKALKFLLPSRWTSKKQKIILLSPKGKQFNQKMASQFSKLNKIVFICGRYEGVDARVEKLVDKKVSVGDYVLTGGELPAMIIIDAITRLLPGVINKESLKEETFNQLTVHACQSVGMGGSNQQSTINFEYPQYTRPEVFTYKNRFAKIKKLKVPKILLSGDHKKIAEWRKAKSLKYSL
ncbi:tRNA (guanosine(37)-N1)-methyltransferase TrmD [Candidatus Parcubacteria bacterium 4484_255]|nr:MAG: tRNA (guanosine(37)-N1)-methyltransferase TrmD [Candidatus Parcubacteria bacterium 4484_255]